MAEQLSVIWTKDHNGGMVYGVPVVRIENGVVYSNMDRKYQPGEYRLTADEAREMILPERKKNR